MSDTRDELLERWLESPHLSDRPKSPAAASWSKLGEAFIGELTRSWEIHGKKAIETIADKKPDVYLKLVASFAKQDTEPTSGAFDDVSDAELRDLVRAARAAVRTDGMGGRGSEGES